MDFQNKKITVMGLGLLGRGIGIVKYLVEKGAKVTVTDLKTARELKLSIDGLKQFYNKIKNQKSKIKITNKKLKRWQIQNTKYKIQPIKFVLGGHRMEDFRGTDMVFKAAGVPLDSPYIAEARRHGVPVFMDDAFFAREASCQIIGITGTRGKTTTSTLIYELLKTAGQRVYLAGNIHGTATLPLLDKVKKNDIVVLELSSWQLQGWRDFKISPHIAVVTNIYKDHMNYYKNSMVKYVRDKEAIFENQNKNYYLVLNKNCPWCQKMAKKALGKVVWFSFRDVPSTWKLKILGKHNLENVAAAVTVGKILGLSVAQIKKVVENFYGVPGRLEFVREICGVRYYNDTTATMPEATIAALAALAGAKKQKNKKIKKQIVLIAGGSDKNLNFKNLAQVIKKYTKAVVLLNGSATLKLKKELQIIDYRSEVAFNANHFWSDRTKSGFGKCRPQIVIVDSLKKAVQIARKFATSGDVVLFSPAAASFGMFKNEFDRGEKFLKEIKKLK